MIQGAMSPGERTETMMRARIGPWTIDRAAGTASDGDVVVKVQVNDDGSYTLRYAGPVSFDEQIRVSRQASEAVQSCRGIRVWRGPA